MVVFTSATATPRLAPFRNVVPGPVTIVALQAEASGPEQQRTGARVSPGSCVLKAFVGVLPENPGRINRRVASTAHLLIRDHAGAQQCDGAQLLRPPRLGA